MAITEERASNFKKLLSCILGFALRWYGDWGAFAAECTSNSHWHSRQQNQTSADIHQQQYGNRATGACYQAFSAKPLLLSCCWKVGSTALCICFSLHAVELHWTSKSLNKAVSARLLQNHASWPSYYSARTQTKQNFLPSFLLLAILLWQATAIQESGWVSYRYSELMEAELAEEAFAASMPYLDEHASPLVSYSDGSIDKNTWHLLKAMHCRAWETQASILMLYCWTNLQKWIRFPKAIQQIMRCGTQGIYLLIATDAKALLSR